MDRRPTIIDVALKAGVSKSTVSLVLQNSPAVREETRALVRQAMADIGYVYNRAAANLRSANAGLVGLVINDLRNPFFAEFATSAQMELSARGFAAVVANTDDDPVLQEQVVGAMIEHGVSALILSPAYDGEGTFDLIERAGIPAIQVLRRVVSADRFPFAAPDYSEGGALAAEHLVANGARRIAFIGGVEGREVTKERMAGCLEVLARAAVLPVLIHGRPTRALGRAVAATLIADHPEVDAAICFNDRVALGLIAGLTRLGREVGPKFRVVGFDDIEEAAESVPSLSSVHCGVPEFGRRMAATVLDWLDTGIAPPAVTRTPVSLVVRESSQPS